MALCCCTSSMRCQLHSACVCMAGMWLLLLGKGLCPTPGGSPGLPAHLWDRGVGQETLGTPQ